ncbi:AAA family ATPase [Phaeodactylibacter xiamenensis]|uniref:AAA family ATPase n=1 Tax=Phaeodactylibacter xiamenensis TaxID=1524460 RepID=UPI0024A8B5FD|nr:AAA family ATPase [Phaeodactylibacter xiamenensis]
MKATKVKLKNFRSFGPEVTTIKLEDDLTGVVGANSSGKTTLLEAFRKVFGSSHFERVIQKPDFHIPGGTNPQGLEELDLYIEFIFEFKSKPVEAPDQDDETEVTPQAETEELTSVVAHATSPANLIEEDNNQPGGEDDTSESDSDEAPQDGDEDRGIPSFFKHMVVDAPGTPPYLRIRLSSTWQKDPINIDGIIETQLVFITCAEGEEENDTNVLAFPKHKRSLIQSFYVPAIRRPSDQIKFVSGSVLHRLFKKIQWPEEFETSFKEKLEEINTLFQGVDHFGNIQEKLATLWSNYNKDNRYNEASIAFGSSDFDAILKKLEIEFSPTDSDRPFRISELGEGYRSLFYLTLVSTLLKIEEELEVDEGEKPILTLLLIEEPENHIAPQLLGRVLKNLNELSKQQNVQVVISSHTPAIISRIEPEAIRHLRLDESAHNTIASQIALPEKTDEAFKFIKEAVRNYPEIYFSKLVVLGEGDSEEIIFKMLSRIYEKDFDDHFITVAPLGGRYVNHIWRLLNQLNIPYVTLLDLDREREGGGWGRVKYAINQIIFNSPELKKELLRLKDGKILSDEKLEKMHDSDPSKVNVMNLWIKRLENYDVFFSVPLDLDFMMLQTFDKEYQNTAIRGPRIPNKEKASDAFKEKVLTGLRATLKSENATGATYSEAEKELMIWYNYLFLGRGKPSTHLLALSAISDQDLKDKMPNVLQRLFKRIQKKIN